MALEDEYTGDAAWQELCAMFRVDIFRQYEGYDTLMEAMDSHEDLAMVLSSSMCDPLGWLHKTVPALDNLTPSQCAKTEHGVLRLRECLMRMHN